MPRKYISKPRPAIRPISASIAYLELTQGQFALIDAEDAEAAEKLTWQAIWMKSTKSFYARRSWRCKRDGRTKNEGLHTFLDAAARDHKNGNTLDYRRANLRPATTRQNARNRKLRADNVTGLKGVEKKEYGWGARITVNGKTIYLGGFKTPEAAHAAYCNKAKEIFGEFARFE